MPIEIRPSDVMFGLAKVLQQGSDLVAGIHSQEDEKERVKEVNDGLILSEKARRADLESYQNPKKAVEVYPEATDPGGGPLLVGKPEYKALGDVPQSVIEDELHKQQAALEQQITLSTKNKQARDELIARSRLAALDHRDRVMGEWRSASQGVYLTGVKDYATLLTMDKETPVDTLVEKMQDRMAEGIGSGWVTRDAADTYMLKFEDDLQYARALNGTLELASATEREVTEPVPTTQAKAPPPAEGENALMSPSETQPTETVTHTVPVTPEQAVANAEAYLNSVPYYKDKPEERDKIFAVVLRKYTAMTQANDAAVDSKYAMAHIQASTVEEIDVALSELEKEKIYDGNVRYTWETRLQSKRDDMIRAGTSAAAAANAATTEAGTDALSALYWSDKTTREYGDGISRLLEQNLISDETARKWLAKDSERSDRQNTFKLNGYAAIETAYDAALAKVRLGTKPEDKKKFADLLIAKGNALDKYTRAIAGMGPGDSAEISAVAATYAWVDMPDQAAINLDDMDITNKDTLRDLILSVKQQKISLGAAGSGKVATATATILTQDFGATGVKWGGDKRAFGVPVIKVKGLEPGQPDDTYWYFLDVGDDNKLRLMMWNLADDPVPSTATTLVAKRAKDVAAATTKVSAEGLAGEAAIAQIEELAGTKLTAKELRQVAQGPTQITPTSMEAYNTLITGRTSVTMAEVEAFVKANPSVTMTWLQKRFAEHKPVITVK